MARVHPWVYPWQSLILCARTKEYGIEIVNLVNYSLTVFSHLSNCYVLRNLLLYLLQHVPNQRSDHTKKTSWLLWIPHWMEWWRVNTRSLQHISSASPVRVTAKLCVEVNINVSTSRKCHIGQSRMYDFWVLSMRLLIKFLRRLLAQQTNTILQMLSVLTTIPNTHIPTLIQVWRVALRFMFTFRDSVMLYDLVDPHLATLVLRVALGHPVLKHQYHLPYPTMVRGYIYNWDFNLHVFFIQNHPWRFLC
jgi:hypothetical protein